MKKKRHVAQAVLAAVCGLSAAAAAQPYPAQPVRMVVGYGAGGGADTLIRAISPELSEALGQPVVIENRPGAGTVIGTQVVASSKPDGYTFLVADNAFYVNPFLFAKLPFDSARDFVPVVPLTGSSTTLGVVHPSLPVRSVKALVAPTFGEAGFPEIDATSYRGLLAPAKTPRAAIMRLNADANKVLQMPAVRARLAELSYDVIGGTPEDYGRLIASEMDKWGRTIRSAGIKAQ